MSEERSHDEQKSQETLPRQLILRLMLMLSLPAIIPLIFLTQNDDPMVIGILITTSVSLLLLNALLLRRLLRRVARQVAQAKREAQDPPRDPA